MRTLRNLPVPQDGDNAKFPDGQIKNQTATEQGTPVVRELYGDVLTNIYKILRDAGIEPTETEDSEDTQYQFLKALKVFSNEINDLSQVLTVDALNINVNFDFDHLPNNYVFIGLLSDAVTSASNYTINSSGDNSYPIVSVGNVSASSYVLVILNQAGGKIIPLLQNNDENSFVDTSFGFPLAFNETDTMYFFLNGILFSNQPASYDIQSAIQAFETNANLVVVEAIIHKGKLICSVYDTVTTENFSLYAFDMADLTTVENRINVVTETVTQRAPYLYCDGDFVYLTNTAAEVNDSDNDYEIGKYLFDEEDLTLTASSFFLLNAAFEKTTNLFINKASGLFYTFVNGTLQSWNPDGSAAVQIGFFPTVDGVVFKFNELTYYSNGNIGTKWNL